MAPAGGGVRHVRGTAVTGLLGAALQRTEPETILLGPSPLLVRPGDSYRRQGDRFDERVQGATMLSYRAEMRRADQRVAGVPSATLDTAWGTVEYIDDGQGTPVLLSHGVLGGHDNGRDLVTWYVGSGYRAIRPSRFGYLGSSMPDDATPVAQADVYAALLDHLGLDRAAMLGFSAGGPAAIEFALRHADRSLALVLASSYLPGMARPLRPVAQRVMRAAVGWGRGWWLLKTVAPGLLARIMGVPKGWDASHDPQFLSVREHLFPTAPKRLGVAFDALVSEPMSNELPLEDIAVPTLFVHAADDRLAPYEYVPPASARIPGSQLVTVAAGGHLFLEHQDQVREAVGRFVDAVAAKV
jgi:pimeloyl-ACP methyl ester carboxylesterase